MDIFLYSERAKKRNFIHGISLLVMKSIVKTFEYIMILVNHNFYINLKLLGSQKTSFSLYNDDRSGAQ